jgi:hypothetical protein
MIRGNTFGPLAKGVPPGTPKIQVMQSKETTITDNRDVAR